MDEGDKKYFAVFGKPVLHSRSPQLYNTLFKKDKINACYTRIHVQTGRAVCEIIRLLGLSGANVTTPFKEEVLPFLDRISPGAKTIGAVNTIINNGRKLTGYNTDAGGVTGSLLEAGIPVAGRKCLVLGTGGAGKAAVTGLIDAGAEVTIVNRSAGKALDFSKLAGCRFEEMDEAARNIGAFDILVLAIPPGIYPFGHEQIRRDMIIVDANYRSSGKTAATGKFPCRFIKGDRWLLHQAVAAYGLFTGKVADTAVMEEGLKQGIDPEKLVIKAIRDGDRNAGADNVADMLVDGRSLNDFQINELIDEERSKAFAGKG